MKNFKKVDPESLAKLEFPRAVLARIENIEVHLAGGDDAGPQPPAPKAAKAKKAK